jgi:hypothetical protein
MIQKFCNFSAQNGSKPEGQMGGIQGAGLAALTIQWSLRRRPSRRPQRSG